jgi:fibronectin-binding autotransporter adhesin
MADNKIQIKRSVSTSAIPSLSNGELAFTQAGNTLHIGLPDGSGNLRIGGAMVPGTLTANQALVANATSGIDKVIVANLVPTVVWANGAAGSAGQLLTSNSTGVYWNTPAPSVVGSDTQVQFNDGGSLGADSGLTFNKTTDTLSTNSLLATSTVNAATLSVGTAVVANSTRLVIGTTVGVQANGGIGTAGQVLHSNGTTAYWAATTADITSVVAGSGLTGGGTSGDVTLDIGSGNGISVSTDAIAVIANSGLVANTSGLHILTTGDSTLIANATGLYVNDATISIATTQLTGDVALGTQTSGNYVASVSAANGINGAVAAAEGAAPSLYIVANNGIVANSTGVFAKQANGTSVDASGINVLAGSIGGLISNTTGVWVNANNGLVANATGLHVGSGNGISVSSDAIAVTTGSTLTVNTGGVHVNSILSIDSLTLTGNLTVLGDLVTMNVATLSVEDSLITLAKDQGSTGTFTDGLDIGFVGTYGNTANLFYTGLFRDQSDSGLWKLFNSNGAVTNTNVATTTGFNLGTLSAFLRSGGLSTNSTSANLIANSTYAVGIVANSLTLSTPLAGTSGGTGKSTMTNNAILVGNSTNGYNELALGTTGHVLQSNGTALVYDTLDGGTF